MKQQHYPVKVFILKSASKIASIDTRLHTFWKANGAQADYFDIHLYEALERYYI